MNYLYCYVQVYASLIYIKTIKVKYQSQSGLNLLDLQSTYTLTDGQTDDG